VTPAQTKKVTFFLFSLRVTPKSGKLSLVWAKLAARGFSLEIMQLVA
jgi:hypothetical protein